MYFIFHKSDGEIEESNENKYLTLFSTDENKDILKLYTELRNKIKNLIRSITNVLGDYDEKYMRIKFNSDDNLLLNKILKLHISIIVVRSDFQEDTKCCPRVFLDEYLYEL